MSVWDNFSSSVGSIATVCPSISSYLGISVGIRGSSSQGVMSAMIGRGLSSYGWKLDSWGLYVRLKMIFAAASGKVSTSTYDFTGYSFIGKLSLLVVAAALSTPLHAGVYVGQSVVTAPFDYAGNLNGTAPSYRDQRPSPTSVVTGFVSAFS